MASLDKEMAEERAENLQQEVNLLKEKIDEIKVDLEAFEEAAAPQDGEGGSSVTVIQLERQNERLTEALFRLREVTTEQEAELKRKIASQERDIAVLEDAKKHSEKMRETLLKAEGQVEDLKQQLDDALGAEELVEQLTEKNLNLSERIEELEIAVEDLEALKELNDELEENHVETEKQLQEEIDHKNAVIREQLKRSDAAEETMADYEHTIQQFRELVTSLQDDIEQLKQNEAGQANDEANDNLISQSHAMISLNMQLQSTVMKAQAKQIDLELRKLEATQAAQHLAHIEQLDSMYSTT
ncbi:hypothetical protein BDF19DRAFT_130733 [Syncephalis fuscata]|nr:hypothetical protein BDF19DRAFT_130733 [Syncephalis fuscata]